MRHQAKRSLLWQAAILFALFFYFPAAAIAQTAVGTITGIVTGGASSNLLPNLAVGVYRSDNPTVLVKTVLTNATGVFSFTGLTAGNYKIRFIPTGININYIGGWYKKNTSPPASAAAAFADGDVITITSSAGSDLGETQLAAGLTITGYVTDKTTSSPVGGVYVKAYSNGAWERTSGAASSAEDGSYTISGLREGSYTLCFWAYHTAYTTEWYSKDTETNTVPDAGAASDVAAGSSGVNAKLSVGGSISGKVSYKTGGLPVAGALVAVYDSASPAVLKGFTTTSATVDASGNNYTVRGLPANGSYLVRFHEKFVNNAGTGLTEWYDDASSAADSKAKALVFSAGSSSIPRIDAELDRGPISGKVTGSSGSPAVGISVKVYDSISQAVKMSAATDAKGLYVTEELPAGTYKVQFSPTSWYKNKESFDAADTVPAGFSAADGIFPLQPGILAPVYNLLLMKKHCLDADNMPADCNCLEADGTPAYCSGK